MTIFTDQTEKGLVNKIAAISSGQILRETPQEGRGSFPAVRKLLGLIWVVVFSHLVR